jgi:hypothetical protein
MDHHVIAMPGAAQQSVLQNLWEHNSSPRTVYYVLLQPNN